MGSSLGWATQYSVSSADSLLLRADAVLFATVSSIKQVPGTADLIEVTLSDLNVVTDRVHTSELNPSSLVVRGTLDGSRAHIDRDLPDLRVRVRYLFFLQGGAWQTGPWITFQQPYFPLQDGTVRCMGGEVFDVGLYGLECSIRDRQVGPPLSEAQLAATLRRASSDARARRPSEAADADRRTQPISRPGVAP